MTGSRAAMSTTIGTRPCSIYYGSHRQPATEIVRDHPGFALPLQLLRPTPLSIEMPPPFGMRGADARLQSSEHADSILPLRDHAILCVPVLFDTTRQRVVPHPLLPRHTLRRNYPRHLRRIHLRAHCLKDGRLISGAYYRRSAAHSGLPINDHFVGALTDGAAGAGLTTP